MLKNVFNLRSGIKMKKFRLIVIVATVFIMLGVLTSRSYAAQENQCLTCHTKFKERAKSIHAAMGMGCEACHKPWKAKPIRTRRAA